MPLEPVFALGDGQGWWLRRQLLAAGVPVFGVRFLDSASDLRRALCARFGVPGHAKGRRDLLAAPFAFGFG